MLHQSDTGTMRAANVLPVLPRELLVVCRATGLSSSLVFKGSQGLVSGSLEQMMGSSSYSHLGTLEGCWRSRVVVRCPKLGMEGVIHEEGPELRPALSDTISLASLGPQQMPRLWSALHDALLYNDPNKASGGKLSHQLGSLELVGVSSRDTVLPGAGTGSDAHAGNGAQGGSDGDSDDDGPSGHDAAPLGKRQGQEPDVMPCYKAAPRRRSPLKRREIVELNGSTSDLIWDSGLMEKSLTPSTLLEKARQYNERVESRRQTGKVLAYVTPWHKRGYDLAVKFSKKLTHVSPVWYQLHCTDKVWSLTGQQDVDGKWLNRMRRVGGGPKIMPRVLISLPVGDLVQMLQDPETTRNMLVAEVIRHSYDGLVLEIWSAWTMTGGMDDDGFSIAAMDYVSTLRRLLRFDGTDRELFLAVPPVMPASHRSPFLKHEHLAKLQAHVDGWSVMTYDYSNANGSPGPNAPISWLEKNVAMLTSGQRPDAEPLSDTTSANLLMGVAFYGWDSVACSREMTPVTADGIMTLMRGHEVTIQWDEGSSEHIFEYTDDNGAKHRVYYPSPRSLEQRLEMFQKAGLGISIWELGQGMECFMDLL
ncbi:MAG: hypothetical protein WDW36_004748 [Sanguina aurantia]